MFEWRPFAQNAPKILPPSQRKMTPIGIYNCFHRKLLWLSQEFIVSCDKPDHILWFNGAPTRAIVNTMLRILPAPPLNKISGLDSKNQIIIKTVLTLISLTSALEHAIILDDFFCRANPQTLVSRKSFHRRSNLPLHLRFRHNSGQTHLENIFPYFRVNGYCPSFSMLKRHDNNGMNEHFT